MKSETEKIDPNLAGDLFIAQELETRLKSLPEKEAIKVNDLVCCLKPDSSVMVGYVLDKLPNNDLRIAVEAGGSDLVLDVNEKYVWNHDEFNQVADDIDWQQKTPIEYAVAQFEKLAKRKTEFDSH